MARQHNVEGTKSYLIAAIALALFSIWCIRDGWFPTEAIKEKHKPEESFYLFNQICGVASLIGAIVCGYIHKVVK